MLNSIFPKTTDGLSGSTLKIIAILTMLIDHIAAILISPSEPVYMLFRLIGRLAFPIFCFLLVEGFLYTKNIKNYAFRLFLFALISEVPFDLAIAGNAFSFAQQNVFFTLFIGLTTIALFAKSTSVWIKFLILIAGMLLAYFANTDYGHFGILAIVVIYILRKDKSQGITFACLCLTFMNSLELSSFAILPLISSYNGKRGLSLKYIFYVFYPAHLLLLYFIGKLF